MTYVIQQLRVEVNESIRGRMDMLNIINTALQNVSVKPNGSKPYRISVLLPRNWGRQQRRKIIPKLHVRLALVDASVIKPRRNNTCQC